MESTAGEEADTPSAMREVTAATASWITFADMQLDEARMLGQGAFGSVYRGVFMGHDVAIKRGNVHRRDAQAQHYLAKELETLSACGEHPNLLRYYGACLHAGYAYIVTEFCPGGDLSSLLNDVAVELPWRLRVKLARDAADGLLALHSRGLIHRDIKGDNILLDDGWRAVIADYGFSRRVEGGGSGRPAGEHAPAAMTILGSASHMAPEVIFGEAYDQRADVYSFGTVLAHMLFRRTPGEGGFMERQPRSKFALDLDALRAGIPPDAPPSLVEATMQCLAYDPDDRLDSGLVLEWLTELVGELGGPSGMTDGVDAPCELVARRRKAAGGGTGGEGEGGSGEGGAEPQPS